MAILANDGGNAVCVEAREGESCRPQPQDRLSLCPLDGQAQAPDRVFNRCFPGNFQSQVAGNLVDPGRIEGQPPRIDGGNDIHGALKFRRAGGAW